MQGYTKENVGQCMRLYTLKILNFPRAYTLIMCDRISYVHETQRKGRLYKLIAKEKPQFILCETFHGVEWSASAHLYKIVYRQGMAYLVLYNLFVMQIIIIIPALRM